MTAETACFTGDSGIPFFLPRFPSADDDAMYLTNEGAEKDLLVGIVSYANYSALDETGIGGVLLSGIRDWIDDVTSQQVCIIICPQMLFGAFFSSYSAT